jgi:peroxiredoxin
MQSNFLESDSFCAKRILIFGINRVQSHATIKHVKEIDASYQQFLDNNIDEVHCVSFCDFLLFNQLMPYMSKKIKFSQLDQNNLTAFQTLLNKKGHHQFLKEYWQFACILNCGQVEYYAEQPFPKIKISPDTWVHIYSTVDSTTVLAWLSNKSV